MQFSSQRGMSQMLPTRSCAATDVQGRWQSNAINHLGMVYTTLFQSDEMGIIHDNSLLSLPHDSYQQTPGVFYLPTFALIPDATGPAPFHASLQTQPDSVQLPWPPQTMSWWLTGWHSTCAMVETWDYGMVIPASLRIPYGYHKPLFIVWSVPLYPENNQDHGAHNQKIPWC